jgi:hypothetical protein
MKLLEDIPAFPEQARETLESEYGIESAEALYAHAVNDPEGLRAALNASAQEVDRLIQLVARHLPPEFVERCRKPPEPHPRGLIIDRD